MLQKLASLRKEKKWSMQEVADQLGIAKSTYAGYELGYREPPLQALCQLADLFEITIDDLLERENSSARVATAMELTSLLTSQTPFVWTLDGVTLSEAELLDAVAFIRTKRMLAAQLAKKTLPAGEQADTDHPLD